MRKVLTYLFATIADQFRLTLSAPFETLTKMAIHD